MRNSLLTFVTVFIFCQFAFSQFTVTPPSPAGAGLARNVNVPVNLYTGIPEISIPLVSIPNSNGMSIPVGLSYHGGGIKVQDVAGPVGLGWSLVAGGMITRTVKGIPDKENNFWNPGDSDFDKYQDIYLGFKDGQHDDFYFSFPGGQGKFQVSKDGTTAYTIPYQEILIEKSGTFANCEWVITDAGGNRYYYGQLNTDTYEEFMNIETMNNLETYDGDEDDFVSSWYLRKMVPSNQTHPITFSYESGSNYDYEYYYATAEDDGDSDNIYDDLILRRSTKVIVKQPKYLSSISASGGQAILTWSDDRKEIDMKYLSSILIKDHSSNLIETIKFNYDYFDSGDSFFLFNQRYDDVYSCTDKICKRLCLRSLERIHDGVKSIYKVFNYYDSNINSYGQNLYSLPPRGSEQYDHRGYFNGQVGDGLLQTLGLPAGVNTNSHRYDASRKLSNFQFSIACTLKEIVNTDNTFVRFNYEAHNPAVGGFRIHTVETGQFGLSPEVLLSTLYSYGAGVVFSDPVTVEEWHDEQNDPAGIMYSSSTTSMFDQNGASIGYPEVTITYSNGGKEVFYFYTSNDTGHNDVAYTIGEATSYSVSTYPTFGQNTSKFWTRGIVYQHDIIDPGQTNPIIRNETDYNISHSSSTITLDNIHSFIGGGGYVAYKYNTLAKPITVTQTETTKYDAHGNSSNTITTYNYGSSPYPFPSTLRWSETDIDGEKYRTDYRYVFDICNGTEPSSPPTIVEGYWTMYNAHNLIPIEIVQSIKHPGETNYSYVSGELGTFQRFDYQSESYVVPYKSYKLYLEDPSTTFTPATLSGTSFVEEPYYSEISEYSYDGNGILQSIATSDGTTAQFTWGQGNTVKTSESVGTFTTNYTNSPFQGVSEITDPNNRDTKYEYDPLNRIRLIRDHEDNIVERYRYHYKDQDETLGGSIEITGINKINETLTFTNPAASSFYGKTRFIWDFGDGTVVETDEATITHVYTVGGTYDITLSMINPEYDPVQISENDFDVYNAGISPTILAFASTFCTGTNEFNTKEGDFGDDNSSTSHFWAQGFGAFCTSDISYDWQYKEQGTSTWTSMGIINDVVTGNSINSTMNIPASISSGISIGLYDTRTFDIRMVMTDECSEEYTSNTLTYIVYGAGACP